MSWWETKWGRLRLAAERKVMSELFPKEGKIYTIQSSPRSGWSKPDFRVIILERKLGIRDGNLRWRIVVHFSDARDLGLPEPHIYEFTVTYPRHSYPEKYPRPSIISKIPDRERCPHLMSDGYRKTRQPCIFDVTDSAAHGWDPQKTATTIVLWTIDWLMAYMVWRDRGCRRWPGKSAH